MVWEKAQTEPVSEQPESGKNTKSETGEHDDIVVVSLEFKESLPAKDRERLQAWLNQRYEGKAVRMFVNTQVSDI